MRSGSGRARGAGLLMAVALLLVTQTGPARSDDDPAAGDVLESGGGVLADAEGQLAAVIPFAGGGRFPIRLGTTGARMDRDVAIATSGVIDTGVLGALATLAVTASPTLDALGVPQDVRRQFALPPPVTADSRAERHITNYPFAQPIESPGARVVGGRQHATAPEGGPAVARTTAGGVELDLGPLTLAIGAGVSESVATAEEVRSVSEVSEVRIGDVVRLGSLRWEVSQRLDGPRVASFSAGLSIAGLPELRFEGPDGLHTLATVVNGLLASAGVTVQFPVLEDDGRLSPITVQLSDSQLAQAVLGPLYAAVLSQFVNEAEVALVELLAESGAVITVLNIYIGALIGQGGSAVEIGGVRASIGYRPVETFVYDRSEPLEPVELPAAPVGDDHGGPAPLPLSAFPSDPVEEAAPVRQVLPGQAGLAGSVEVDEAIVPAWILLAAAAVALAAIAAIDRRRTRRLLPETP